MAPRQLGGILSRGCEDEPFAALTVHGAIENEDSLYDRDRVRCGRVLQVEVTPSTKPKVGCAFAARRWTTSKRGSASVEARRSRDVTQSPRGGRKPVRTRSRRSADTFALLLTWKLRSCRK